MSEPGGAARPVRSAAAWSGRRWTIGLCVLVVAILVVRMRFLGNPNVDADEQFYLLTGDRMLRGALPYVDIWDRKPVGLFLLFAGMRLLSGDGILGYQIVAAICVAATALLIAAMARRIASPVAALSVAFVYALMLGLSGGQGGQTPVFYNLPMALAAWLVLDQVAARTAAPRLSLRRDGIAAMLLVGVAMQLKYNAVFEGLYLGVVLLATSWRRDPRALPCLADAALWVGAALLPTGLAWIGYIALGHGPEFVYANFSSIFARASLSAHEQRHNLAHLLGRVAPVLPLAVAGAAMAARPGDRVERAAHRFLLGWLLASAAAIAIFGTFFNHYVLPLLPPLLIVAARALSIRKGKAGTLLTALLLIGMTGWYYAYAAKLDRRKGNGAYAHALADRIRPMLNGGCLYVFYDEPIFYHLTNSCLPTRWPFPYHLSLSREAPALGVDPHAELARIMATRPPVVLTQTTDDVELSASMQAQLMASLRRDYRLAYTHTFAGKDPNTDQLWRRLPGR